MSYEIVNAIPQFNFQANRVLTYGDQASNRDEVRERIAVVRTAEEWYSAWLSMAQNAERNQKYLHAAYYYRMAEFFIKSGDHRKIAAYRKCIENFYKGFDLELCLRYERVKVPFEGKTLNALKLSPDVPAKGTIVVCGGYDSFIEEFVLQVHDFVKQGFQTILFDGPGQGECPSEKLYFRYDFEKPVSAVLDYFHIQQCAMVGISWGGYFALRSAAYEKRISAAAAYDVMDNGYEVMTNILPAPVCAMIRFSCKRHWRRAVNFLVGKIRRKSVLADWAFSQGLYITGTSDPYAFYQALSFHDLAGITDMLTQDILLLAGENDHYIPLHQYYRLKKSIVNARSLTCRLFTKEEGGEQHCQVGNHMLAVNAIADWLDRYF